MGPRRVWWGNDKLILSLGSWLLPSGTFCYGTHFPWSPAGDGVSTIHRPPAIRFWPGSTCHLPLVPGFVIGVPSDAKKREGNEEGDQLELLHPSKETIPRKETSEVDEKLHPVNWYRPACRTGSLFRAGPSSRQFTEK